MWEIREIRGTRRFGRFGRFGEIREIREIRTFRRLGDLKDRGESLYVAKIENLLEPRRIPGIRSLGDSEEGEIPVWEIAKFGKWGGVREKFCCAAKIRTSGNPERVGKMGNSGASGDTGNLVARGLRRIGENRYM